MATDSVPPFVGPDGTLSFAAGSAPPGSGSPPPQPVATSAAAAMLAKS
jgi:hypothetical protein